VAPWQRSQLQRHLTNAIKNNNNNNNNDNNNREQQSQEAIEEALFDLFQRRHARLIARRELLLTHCSSEDSTAANTALIELAGVQKTMMFSAATYFLTFFDSLIDLRQFSDYSIAAWPHTLSVDHISNALKVQRRRRLEAKSGE